MRRWIGWTSAVAAVATLWAALMFAPHLLAWASVTWAVGLPVAGCLTVALARHRRERVAESLRPYGQGFITLQDDLLGRPHTAGSTWTVEHPTPTLVDDTSPDAGPMGDQRPGAHP